MGPFSEDELKSLPSDGSWCLLLNDLKNTFLSSWMYLTCSTAFHVGAWRMFRLVYLVKVVVLEHILISSTCFLFKELAISDGQFQTVQNAFLTTKLSSQMLRWGIEELSTTILQLT